jgi:hypothetical protein
MIAADPEGPLTRARSELLPGVRSFHIRHARGGDTPRVKVRRPVHVVYYRTIRPGLIEIVRVLHQSMEPTLHFETVTGNRDSTGATDGTARLSALGRAIPLDPQPPLFFLIRRPVRQLHLFRQTPFTLDSSVRGLVT